VSRETLQWLEWLSGSDWGDVPTDARAELVWSNLPPDPWGAVWLLAAVLLAGAAGWLYSRDARSCQGLTRGLLIGLRVAALVLLAIVLLGPAIQFTTRRDVTPQIALLRDDSFSMQQADRYQSEPHARAVAAVLGIDAAQVRARRPQRHEVVAAALQNNQQQVLRKLSERGKLRLIDFSASARERSLSAAEPASDNGELKATRAADSEATGQATTNVRSLPEQTARGSRTDLAPAVKAALASSPLAAIVVFTDGQFNAGNALEAARQAKRQNVPLLLVAVGDPTPLRNLRVLRISADDTQLGVGDPFEIQVVVESQGSAESGVEIELREQRLDSAGAPREEPRVIERRRVDLAAGRQRRESFSRAQPVEGKYAYSVRLTPRQNEITDADNLSKNVEVKVVRKPARVLLIAGAPSWEYQLVQRLLTRESSIDLSCWLQTIDPGRAQDGNTPITTLPDSKEALREYDAILLLDPNPRDFDANWIKLLEDFVGRHAGGLLYKAGPLYTSYLLSDDRTAGLAALLPVELGDVEAMAVDALRGSAARATPLEPAPAGIDHPVMSFLSDRQAALSRWQRLPGLYWTFPAERPKPAAQTLLRRGGSATSANKPVLASGRFRAGRSIYMGFGGTWRWRRGSETTEIFDRYWLQVTKYLVKGRAVAGRDRGWLLTERSTYDLGESVSVSAYLKDESDQPLEAQEVKVEVSVNGKPGRPLTLRRASNQPGRYVGQLTAQPLGDWRLRVADPGSGGDSGGSKLRWPSAEFEVVRPLAETADVTLNETQLAELAAASGGKVFRIDQLDELVAAIDPPRATVELRDTPRPIWDNRLTLLVLVGLLSIEWAVRKARQLL